MLRAAVKAETPLGLAAKEVMDAEAIGVDNIMIGLVKERLEQPDCATGALVVCLMDSHAPFRKLKHYAIQAWMSTMWLK